MDRLEHIAAQLRARGMRLTRQRRMIVAVLLQQRGHFTVECMAVEVARRDPAIDLATVYRTLHRLAQAGVVRMLDGAHDRLYFEVAAAQQHHHLICSVCGAEQQIDAEVGEVMRAFLRERYHFLVEPEHWAFRGRCAECEHNEGEHAR